MKAAPASPPDAHLDHLLKRLNLANTRRQWTQIVQQAETNEWSHHDFLLAVAREEVAHRQQTRIQRLVRKAAFPFLKTIEEFDFTCQSSLRLAMLGSALAPDFITQGRTVIFEGKPGRGKTHLAVAIAYRAIQNGFDPLFTTAAQLIDTLSDAFRNGRFNQTLAGFTSPHLLVVDEVGYLAYCDDAANMLFHVVNDRHKRHRAMIFTTNKPLDQWGSVLHDHDLAEAIVDRILERGRHHILDGPSMRTRHLNIDKNTPHKPDRISGKNRTEFPEPTPRIARPFPAVASCPLPDGAR